MASLQPKRERQPVGGSYASQTPLSLCLVRRLVSCDMREDFFPIELDELSLLWADLMDVHVVESRINERADLLEVHLGIRTADHRCRDVIFRDTRGCLLEMGRQGEFLSELPWDRRVRPLLKGHLARSRFVLGETDRQLAVVGPRPPALLEGLDDVCFWCGADETVADAAGQFRGVGSGRSDHDRYRVLGKGVQTRILDGEIPPLV